MGIYLNPDNSNFQEVIKSKIYVDKTIMISQINEFMETSNKYLCISRPRRFGKTITGNMLSAYYSKGSDSKALFSKFKISSSFIGINYDEESKTHEYKIECLEK